MNTDHPKSGHSEAKYNFRGFFCHFFPRVPSKYLKITLFGTGHHEIKFLSNLCTSSRPMWFPQKSFSSKKFPKISNCFSLELSSLGRSSCCKKLRERILRAKLGGEGGLRLRRVRRRRLGWEGWREGAECLEASSFPRCLSLSAARQYQLEIRFQGEFNVTCSHRLLSHM